MKRNQYVFYTALTAGGLFGKGPPILCEGLVGTVPETQQLGLRLHLRICTDRISDPRLLLTPARVEEVGVAGAPSGVPRAEADHGRLPLGTGTGVLITRSRTGPAVGPTGAAILHDAAAASPGAGSGLRPLAVTLAPTPGPPRGPSSNSATPQGSSTPTPR